MRFFTAAEVHRRLKEAKYYLTKYRTQRTKFLCVETFPRLQLCRYDAENEMNFICAEEIKEDTFREVVRDNRNLFIDENNYRYMNVKEYVKRNLTELQQLFSFTCMCICDVNGKVLFKAVICLGSLHHAPRILFRNELTNKTFYEKLIAYDDLQ
jgi:hypothetical protein